MATAPLGHFCWPELLTPDLPKARDFYAHLLGWTWRDVPTAGGNYLIAHLGDDAVAGAFQAPASLGPPRWNNYVQVASADDSAERAKALGGTLRAGPTDVPGVGRMAWIADPGGGELALWQSGPHPGATRFGVPSSLAWTELTTPHAELSSAFYASLFGWEARPRTDMPAPYTEFFLHGRSVAGLHPVDRPKAFWLPYFAVPDPTRAAAAAQGAGGRLVVPPTLLPTVGSFAILADPTGARFGVAWFDPESGFTGA